MVGPNWHFVCTNEILPLPFSFTFSSFFARGPLHSSLPSGSRNGSGISYSGSVRRELFQDKQSKLSDDRAEGYITFLFIGNFHGDKPVGRELLLRLANCICDNYAKDSLARLIVENIHLHILPSMNPDGYFSRRRGNANNIDLNRDFPDHVSHFFCCFCFCFVKFRYNLNAKLIGVYFDDDEYQNV
ncbi:hypothetical protein NC653_005657 [Populus alba x Populus x berolinensis]|uniref:Peptidase M14 domain-containing protein n=1 Tax=Populus alba x Populus x berolinensis TaxID=444605 RepID=A0AAD6RCE4_9ROSI|nr:hypothetical protein NC653_005657 [Populus alba x Populus x berolinensis]